MPRGKRKRPIAAIGSWTERIGNLASVVDRAKPRLVRALEVVIARQVASGADPYGKAWKKTKQGQQPLRGAASAVDVRATGNVLTVTVTRHHARHHLGAVRGKVRRRILPSKKLPNPYAAAVRRVLVSEFNRTMKAGTS